MSRIFLSQHHFINHSHKGLPEIEYEVWKVDNNRFDGSKKLISGEFGDIMCRGSLGECELYYDRLVKQRNIIDENKIKSLIKELGGMDKLKEIVKNIEISPTEVIQ